LYAGCIFTESTFFCKCVVIQQSTKNQIDVKLSAAQFSGGVRNLNKINEWLQHRLETRALKGGG
jgi:hypothetical protein